MNIVLLILMCTIFVSAQQENGLPSNTAISIVTENFAPYNYTIDDSLTGLCTEKIRLLLSELDMGDTEIKVYPWPRAYREAIEQPNVLIYSMVRTTEREDQFKWVGVLDSTDIGIISLVGSDVVMDSLQDIVNYRTAIYRDGPLQEFFNSYDLETPHIITSMDAAIRLLFAGRIDVYPVSIESFLFAAENMGYSKDEFKVIYEIPELEKELWCAFSNDTPDSTVMRFRDGLERIE